MIGQKKLKDIAKRIRLQILKMIFKSKTAHIGGSFSSIEILTVLYFKIMRINPKKPFWEDRDRFILSKGHIAAGLYAVLAERGFFNKKMLVNYYVNGGNFPGHVSRNCVPGIEVSTGSLGHGLAMANGISLAGKRDKKNYRVFVLLSDGECDEGSNWEAILFAGHHKLDNLIAIVDYNKLQAFGKTNEVLNLEPFAAKWRNFGWEAKKINGHNFKEIILALKNIPFKKGKPSVLIAHTIKGKGVSFMENKLEWHYKPPSLEEFKIAIKEIKNL
ncbi:transketolase [Candidatus Wolfebacteria bacterium]|nr:transketolase [Candidatus Wolfebacteria bacterium]